MCDPIITTDWQDRRIDCTIHFIAEVFMPGGLFDKAIASLRRGQHADPYLWITPSRLWFSDQHGQARYNAVQVYTALPFQLIACESILCLQWTGVWLCREEFESDRALMPDDYEKKIIDAVNQIESAIQDIRSEQSGQTGPWSLRLLDNLPPVDAQFSMRVISAETLRTA